MNKMTVLLIDDEESQIQSLTSFLKRRDYTVLSANDGKEGVRKAEENVVDIVLTDFRMPEWDGMTVLEKIKELNPEIDVVVITAFGRIEDAVGFMKKGAYDYLTKPIDLDELENLLERLSEKRMLQSENRQLKKQLKERFQFDTIISQSGKMEDVINTAARVADSKASVLVLGETGTGKELFAKAIHYAGARKDNPFITVNVAALSPQLLESELFGHEKGAFTGAERRRIGRFEEADGGTLFIDEIGDIPMEVQVKLLRAIQFNEVQRIGSNETIKTDVRIVAATHHNLEQLISENKFREDLFYRLNVVSIIIPPLRERKEDIPLLIEHFIKKSAEANDSAVSDINREALDKLMKYNFPGNVRELENIIERAVVLARGNVIAANDLPLQVKTMPEKGILDPNNLDNSYEDKVKAFEKTIITEALKRTNGNKSAAARLLDITERHLRSRMERTGLQ